MTENDFIHVKDGRKCYTLDIFHIFFFRWGAILRIKMPSKCIKQLNMIRKNFFAKPLASYACSSLIYRFSNFSRISWTKVTKRLENSCFRLKRRWLQYRLLFHLNVNKYIWNSASKLLKKKKNTLAR